MKKVMCFLLACCLVGTLQAASVSFQTTTPNVGSNDVAFLSESNTDAGNVEGVEGDLYGPDAATYIAHDRAGLGQTFTTGPNTGGYYMQGFWLKHVQYVDDGVQTTWFNTTSADAPLEIRVTDPSQAGTAGFEIRVESYITTGDEPGAFGTGGSGTGTGTWVYFALDNPLILAPNTVYGFDVTVTGGTWFFETAGLNGADSYTGGTAYTTGTTAATNSLNMDTIREGDHTFIVDMVDSFAYESPENGAVNIPIELTEPENDLAWTMIDAAISKIDLYFGTENDPNLTLDPLGRGYKRLDQIDVTPGLYSFDLESLTEDLDYLTTYYWKIVGYEPNTAPGATDYFVTEGPVWSFRTINDQPSVEPVEPAFQAVPIGQASVEMSVIGLNVISYQWYKIGDPDPLADGAEYTGTTTDTLTILDAQMVDEGSYYCVGTNFVGTDSSIDAETGEGAGRLMIQRLTSHWPIDSDNASVADGNDIQLDIVDGYNMVLLSAAVEGSDDGADYPTLDPNVVNAAVVGDESLLLNNSNQSDPNNAWGQYAQVAAGVAEFDDITIALWMYWGGGDSWQRIFDFGNGTGDYMFLAPNAAGTNLRFVIGGAGNEQLVETGLPAIGEWTHVTVTLSGDTARLYVNGELEGTNEAFTFDPLSVNMAINYIGDSQYEADPYFNGLIDDLMIYNYARTTDQIAQDYLDVRGEYVCNNEVEALVYDFNDDCLVNLEDFAMFVIEWLDSNRIYPN